MKWCAGCELDKPLDEFSPAKRGKGGRAYYCRPCAAGKARERNSRPDIKERNAARQRRYRRDNPDQATQDRERSLAWAKANAEAVRLRNLGWRRANPDRARQFSAEYRARNPDVGAAAVHRRRARKMAAPANDFTAADWRAVLADFNHACAYCLASGVPLQQEHMTPLSRGGEHSRSNIVPACGPCNNQKGTKNLLEVLRHGKEAQHPRARAPGGEGRAGPVVHRGDQGVRSGR